MESNKPSLLKAIKAKKSQRKKTEKVAKRYKVALPPLSDDARKLAVYEAKERVRELRKERRKFKQ